MFFNIKHVSFYEVAVWKWKTSLWNKKWLCMGTELIYKVWFQKDVQSVSSWVAGTSKKRFEVQASVVTSYNLKGKKLLKIKIRCEEYNQRWNAIKYDILMFAKKRWQIAVVRSIASIAKAWPQLLSLPLWGYVSLAFHLTSLWFHSPTVKLGWYTSLNWFVIVTELINAKFQKSVTGT